MKRVLCNRVVFAWNDWDTGEWRAVPLWDFFLSQFVGEEIRDVKGYSATLVVS